MSDYYLTDGGELYHYGVKGMRWGHRKKYEYSDTYNNVANTRKEYHSAKKTATRSFNKAYNRSIAAYSPSKKHRQANDARWEKSLSDTDKMVAAKDKYKDARAQYNRQLRDANRQVNRQMSKGQKLIYNKATRKRAARYIVNNNMSVSEATKKAKGDAWRATAAFLTVYGIAAGVNYLRK